MFPYHDENDCRRFPIVNTLLIGANLAVFGYMVWIHFTHPASNFLNEHATVPTRILHHWDVYQLGTLFSSMFMHAGLAHIIGNLWVLYLFGDNVEDRLGHSNYLAFYLACGVAANAAQILSDPNCAIPSLGASGAIAGVLGAYMMLYPKVGVRTWITWFWFMTIPAWVIIGAWFVLQCACSVLTPDEPVGWYAHIGGFLTGISLLFCLKPAKPPEFIDLDGIRVRATESDHALHHSELLQANDLVTSIGTIIFLAFICVAGYLGITRPQHLTVAPAIAARPAVVQPSRPTVVQPAAKAKSLLLKHTKSKHRTK